MTMVDALEVAVINVVTKGITLRKITSIATLSAYMVQTSVSHLRCSFRDGISKSNRKKKIYIAKVLLTNATLVKLV